jgi:hypothetical protein
VGTLNGNFTRLIGEIRNDIYDFPIQSLPRASALTTFPATKLVYTLIYQEFISGLLLSTHCNITSLLDTYSKRTALNGGLTVTVSNFTSIPYTRSRANEEIYFFCHRIRNFQRLGKVAMRIRHDGTVLTPDLVALLQDLGSWLAVGTEYEAFSMYVERVVVITKVEWCTELTGVCTS